ncbi:MAG: imidazole glycerol phosphate synthase subunit HisH [Cytophagales bacterium]|nr:imidazole glycerol phosphate synthase subunit HisH [Cytophagales bacterium]
MITIIDYGVGNLGSIRNMLHRISISSQVSKDPHVVAEAERIILPGIGAFDWAMSKLLETELPDILRERAAKGCPILGICLGAQLLTNKSEEGILPGLGLLAASCIKFNTLKISPLKVPHMGWNEVAIEPGHPIGEFHNLEESASILFRPFVSYGCGQKTCFGIDSIRKFFCFHFARSKCIGNSVPSREKSSLWDANLKKF